MTDWPLEAGRQPADATTAKFVNAAYSSKVINHVRANLVAVATANVYWKEGLAKGNILYIPVMTTLSTMDVDPKVSLLATAIAKSFGTTAEELPISYWKGNPVAIDDSTKLQSSVPDLLAIAADNAKYGLLKAIDTTVNTLYYGAGSGLTGTWKGTDGQTFSDDILIALMEGLDEADVPRENRSLVGDPSMIADIYKIDKFMSYDYNQTVFTTDAYRGKINAYNLPVFCTNNLATSGTGNYGALLQKEAIGVAIQSEPKVEAWREPTIYSDLINVSCFYGAAVIRATFGAYFYTRLT